MIPSHVRIFVCTEPVDFRRSFDGLTLAARERMGEDPRAGGLFCFRNRRSNRMKVLWFDGAHACLLYKRLHRAIFALPGSAGGERSVVRVDGAEFARLIEGVPIEGVRRRIQRQASADQI